MRIQVLGIGCPACRKLAENADVAAKELGLGGAVEKVTDLQEIMRLGVMATPALVVDGVVRAAGRVPSVEEIKRMLAGGWLGAGGELATTGIAGRLRSYGKLPREADGD